MKSPLLRCLTGCLQWRGALCRIRCKSGFFRACPTTTCVRGKPTRPADRSYHEVNLPKPMQQNIVKTRGNCKRRFGERVTIPTQTQSRCHQGRAETLPEGPRVIVANPLGITKEGYPLESRSTTCSVAKGGGLPAYSCGIERRFAADGACRAQLCNWLASNDRSPVGSRRKLPNHNGFVFNAANSSGINRHASCPKAAGEISPWNQACNEAHRQSCRSAAV